ncbi:MAG: GvpL/GvpF family gas vesicle protein, partial [Hyphomicrobiales bacterium]
IEVGIKVSFVDTEIFKEIVAENPELRRQSEDLKNKPPAQTYYERIELGRQVDRRMGAKKAAVAAMLGTRLDGFAVKAVHHATTDDMLVFNASYLIRRADEPALFAAIEKLEAEMQGRLTIRYVAPAPPYNFVSMKLDAVPLAA